MRIQTKCNGPNKLQNALHNSINEMAYDVLKKQGFQIIPYLKKAISISTPVILVHTYFLEESPITNEALKCMKDYPDIIRWSAMILRFANDLGTSSDEIKRGDIPKSIQCYMFRKQKPVSTFIT
ncbi:(R)-limonene synthase, putative [Ricinus communis]|uniref:(R)-limonene synthase, putative n=1 Tax=Ricinus communis TaxID=3988 RepID=B9S897_RICCO|nr:(R)-limonene synthase, putative [Ricinus communis]